MISRHPLLRCESEPWGRSDRMRTTSRFALLLAIITVSHVCSAGEMRYRAIDLGIGYASSIDNAQPAGAKLLDFQGGGLQSHASFWRRETGGSFSFVDVLPMPGDSE